MTAVDALRREFGEPRCESKHPTSGIRCGRPAGHDDYHWHVDFGVNNLVSVWGIRYRSKR